jgi:hypothetical protein
MLPSQINAREMRTQITKIANNHNFNLRAGDGSTLRIKHESESFDDLLITALFEQRIAVAHIYIQNGDVMYDPEITFLLHEFKEDELWIPYGYRNSGLGIDRVYGKVEYDHDQKRYKLMASRPGMEQIRDLRSFCRLWARNLREQGYVKVMPASN